MKQKSGCPLLDGWVILDKPLGMSSALAVARVRALLGGCKAGHAGTLDPLATGLLPIALGEATKTIFLVMDSRKRYHFDIRWGEERETDDLEGAVVNRSADRPSISEIKAVLPHFFGRIRQVPPLFSAIKIKGKRACDLARSGGSVTLLDRNVEIHHLEFTGSVCSDEASFELECGKGTYVRSLARDIGRILGCFGYVSRLRRTRVGSFNEGHIITLEKLEKLIHTAGGERLEERCAVDLAVLPLSMSLDGIPAVRVDRESAVYLYHGRPVTLDMSDISCREGMACAFCEGSPVAIGFVEGAGRFRPSRVFWQKLCLS